MKKNKSILSSILCWCILLNLALTGFILGKLSNVNTTSSAEIVLTNLYSFDNPDDLVAQFEKAKLYMSESVQGQLLMTDSRTINFYYRFKGTSSRVHIVSSYDGIIYYTLENDNIDPTTLWAFEYTLDDSGRIDSVHEFVMFTRFWQ